MKLIQEKIQAFDTIIIHGHIKPDGDSYGAQFGLKNMLTNTFLINIFMLSEKVTLISLFRNHGSNK